MNVRYISYTNVMWYMIVSSCKMVSQSWRSHGIIKFKECSLVTELEKIDYGWPFIWCDRLWLAIYMMWQVIVGHLYDVIGYGWPFIWCDMLWLAIYMMWYVMVGHLYDVIGYGWPFIWCDRLWLAIHMMNYIKCLNKYIMLGNSHY